MHIKINEDKEKTKLNIARIFTKIRSELNKGEDELLSQLDDIYDNKFFKEDLIKKAENLPNQIKTLLNKIKIVNENLNDENKIIERINDCINIENKISSIFETNEIIEKLKLNDIKILFSREKEENIGFLEQIKHFGNIDIKAEELNEEGLEKEAIETLMNEGKCSRLKAIKTLKAHNGDPVEALLEFLN